MEAFLALRVEGGASDAAGELTSTETGISQNLSETMYQICMQTFRYE